MCKKMEEHVIECLLEEAMKDIVAGCVLEKLQPGGVEHEVPLEEALGMF